MDTNQYECARLGKWKLLSLCALLKGAGARTCLTGVILFAVAEASGGSIAIRRFEPEFNLCRASRKRQGKMWKASPFPVMPLRFVMKDSDLFALRFVKSYEDSDAGGR